MSKSTEFDWVLDDLGVDAAGEFLPGRGPKAEVKTEDTIDVTEHQKGCIALADLPSVMAEVMAASGPDDVRVRHPDASDAGSVQG